MIYIDGSRGEGGGQILRSSLTLAMMTGQKLRIDNIRANRKKPGLAAQHLQAVKASQAICNAFVVEAKLGSTRIEFHPNMIRSGNYRFDIRTAGSTSLVLQTVYLPLTKAHGKSSVTVTGGTHVSWSPCFDYLNLQWLPHLEQMGFDINLHLKQAGFYPRGGGQIQAKISPKKLMKPLIMNERGKLKQIRGISAVANLDRSIAERQRSRVIKRLGSKYYLNDIRIVKLNSRFQGTFLLLLAEFENSQCCYFGLGARGKRAERVADEAVDELDAFMTSNGAIDQYLADQLLLPLSFALGQSIIKTSKVTQHLVTNAALIKEFISTDIKIKGAIGQSGMITITPKNGDDI